MICASSVICMAGSTTCAGTWLCARVWLGHALFDAGASFPSSVQQWHCFSLLHSFVHWQHVEAGTTSASIRSAMICQKRFIGGQEDCRRLCGVVNSSLAVFYGWFKPFGNVHFEQLINACQLCGNGSGMAISRANSLPASVAE
jgi:hypothetical protein